MSEKVIETEGLTRRFGQQVAVDDVSLCVIRGDIYGFLGLNGAGKTTTMRMILGLLRPSSGRVRLFGGEGEVGRRAAMVRIGAMVENPAFYGHLSGARNLRLLGSLSGPMTRARVDEVLDLVGLSDAAGKRAYDYSLGMKQRLAIALALVSRPELVLLDEPTNGLDPSGILEMRRLILRLNEEQGVTFVISSHLLHEIEMVCNRVGILEAGKLILEKPLVELMDSVDSNLRLIARPADKVEGVLSRSPATSVEAVDGGEAWTFQILEPELPALHRALVAADVEVYSLARSKMSLEELFLSRATPREEGRLS